MECAACDLVRYCSDACLKEHRPQHEEACVKRAAELVRDKILFRQPDGTHRGDCPICCLPMPLDPAKSIIMPCCSKVICEGCTHANMLREIEGKLEHKCLFCREPIQAKDKTDEMMMKRIEANDPEAMRLGKRSIQEG
eukprot:scaffold5030_cov128-Skeletonema_marinoi.AAC.6